MRITYNTTDVHVWAVHLHIELELLADVLDVLETLLVVGASTADPNLDVVLNEDGRKLPESANDTLECRSNILHELAKFLKCRQRDKP